MATEITNFLFDNAVADLIITEEKEEYMKRSVVVIQKLDGSGEFDISMLFRDTSDTKQRTDSSSDSKNELEASSMMFDSYQEFEERIERETIHWLPFHLCMAVLLATLPWHASQPDLFQTTKTLPQLLRDVYDDLYDEELSNEKDIVLSHRFLNHNFIMKLLNSTSKFVVKHLDNLFSEIITEERERNL